MDEITAGPQYFTHQVAGRELQAWYYVEESSVTVVCLGRTGTHTLDGSPPESAARALLESLIDTDSQT